MLNRTSPTGSELFIVDNSDDDWKALRYSHDWCQLSKSIDVATGYFEIGSLLALKDEWQKVDQIRILMGDEVSLRTRNAFADGLSQVTHRLDCSLESEKDKKVAYSAGTVWIDKAKSEGFEGVPEPVWNFHIGGYQVCEKWLKDRKGRKLSQDDIAHYQKIVVALNETIRLMKEIDEVIEKHGGWPGAFVDKSVEERSER